MAHDHDRERCTGAVRRVYEAGEHRQVVGAVGDRISVEAQHLATCVDRVGNQTTCDHVERMEAVGERRGDAEVAAAAAQGPEEVGMGVGRHVDYLAVSRHELDSFDVVGGEPVLRHQPAEAATECQSRDAGRRDGASGDGEPVLGVCGVQLRPRQPAFGPDRPGFGVDVGVLHLCEVDHHGAVRDASASDVVASSADGDVETAVSCEADSRRSVSSAAAADDDGRLALDERVVDLAGLVVSVVARSQHAAGDPAQRLHVDAHGAESKARRARAPAALRASRGGCAGSRATTSCRRWRTRRGARARRATNSP